MVSKNVHTELATHWFLLVLCSQTNGIILLTKMPAKKQKEVWWLNFFGQCHISMCSSLHFMGHIECRSSSLPLFISHSSCQPFSTTVMFTCTKALKFIVPNTQKTQVYNQTRKGGRRWNIINDTLISLFAIFLEDVLRPCLFWNPNF